MNATRKPWLGTVVGLLTVLLATSAIAAPVVVGSVNPVTHQVTIFQDMLVTTFPDGTPIQHIYGRFDTVTHEFLMVRTGKMADGDCRTDALRLLRLSGNRRRSRPRRCRTSPGTARARFTCSSSVSRAPARARVKCSAIQIPRWIRRITSAGARTPASVKSPSLRW